MMTEKVRQSASGQTTEGEDGESFRVEGRDSSYAKPPQVPTANSPKGLMISSTGSKVTCRKRTQNRTIKREKSMEKILEHQSKVIKES